MTEYDHPVDQLLTFGDGSESKGKWPDYTALGIGPEHIPDLIRMATDMDLNRADGESLKVWAPLHAWRTLGQLRVQEAIDPLVGLLQELEGDDWAGEELPDVFGMIGPAAIPALKAFLEDASHGLFPRIHAGEGLECIGKLHPEAREACVAALAGQLEVFKQNGYELNGFLISNLMNLKATEVAPVMQRAFAAKRVDEGIVGDWEDVQIGLGLKLFRDTPDDDDELFFGPRPEWSDPLPEWRAPDENRQPAAKKAKSKSKRKMAQASRKKNRKRKKKKKR